jgi:predicted GIY-YIG superfamily endonuclease
MQMPFFVYILASKRNGTLYVGVTNNLGRRMTEHKSKLLPGFTRQHDVTLLVYFETFESVVEGTLTRAFVEALATGLEAQADRRAQSGLARSYERVEYLGDVTGSRLCGAALRAAPRPGHENGGLIAHPPYGSALLQRQPHANRAVDGPDHLALPFHDGRIAA